MIEQLENPFPGLRPFDIDEHYLFFGRDGQSEEVITKLEVNRFVAVVGTSGSGKSSLVRAGLLPSLYSGLMRGAGSYWRVAIFRPQDDPIGNLAQALTSPEVFGSGNEEAITNLETTLRRSSFGLIEAVRHARMLSHENLLIVVDQFEELFRFKQDSLSNSAENEKAAFVKLLLEAVKQEEVRIYVILTMRSDYLGECARFRDLPEAINKSQYLIPRMSDDERRESIAGPIAVAEGEITLPLVNRLLNDVGDNPDQLPILQHALMRTWEEWKKSRANSEKIDIPHYESIGGVSKALSNDADAAYNSLSEPRKELAKKLFKRLTEKGLDNREVRRPTTVREICEVAEANQTDVFAVIEAFRSKRRCFLMTQDNVPMGRDSVIDISHESLIRVWDRLKQWVDEEAQSARIYRRLASDSEDYDLGNTSLLPDPALQIALDWREREKPNKVWADRYHPGFEKALEYLDKSKTAREAAAEEKERQEREKFESEQKLIELERKNAVERAAQAQAFAEQQVRTARRLRRLVAALIGIALLAIGMAVFAGVLWRNAKAETNRANEQTKIAEELRIEADKRSREAIIARGDAEMARLESDQAFKALEISKRNADEEHKRAEQQARAVSEERLKAIQNLGDLYANAYSYLSGQDEPTEDTFKNLDNILRVYEQSGVRSGQISTIHLIKTAAEDNSIEPEKMLAYNKKLLNLIGNQDNPQRINLLLETASLYSSMKDKEVRINAAPYYEEALNLFGMEDPVRISAHLRLGEVYEKSNDKSIKNKAVDNYLAALRLMQNGVQPERRRVVSDATGILIRLVALYLDLDQNIEAERYFDKAIAASQDKPDSYSRESTLLIVADRLFKLNNTQKASEYFDKAVKGYMKEYGKSEADAALSAASYGSDVINGAFGEGDVKLWFLNQALKISQRMNDLKAQSSLLNRMAQLNTYKRNSEEVIAIYERLISIYQTLNDPVRESSIHLGTATIYSSLGKYDEALKHLNLALDIYKRLNATPQQKIINDRINQIEKLKNKSPK